MVMDKSYDRSSNHGHEHEPTDLTTVMVSDGTNPRSPTHGHSRVQHPDDHHGQKLTELTTVIVIDGQILEALTMDMDKSLSR